MNFIIHFNFRDFVEGLPTGSTVYTAAFTETRLKEVKRVVVLSSEAALPGGTIHAVRLIIDADEGNEHASAEAADKFKELLLLKGMVRRRGMVLTEGLNDALELYGKTGVEYSLKRIDEMIAEEKNGKAE